MQTTNTFQQIEHSKEIELLFFEQIKNLKIKIEKYGTSRYFNYTLYSEEAEQEEE